MEEIIERTLDVTLVVVVGVYVEELATTGTVELVKKVALLASSRGIAAGNFKVVVHGLGLGVQDGEEVIGLVAVRQHGGVSEWIEVRPEVGWSVKGETPDMVPDLLIVGAEH